jgi:hypothetical protein
MIRKASLSPINHAYQHRMTSLDYNSYIRSNTILKKSHFYNRRMPRKKALEEEKRTMNMRVVNIEFDCRNSILKMLQNYIVEKLQIYHWIANSLINV